MTQQEQHEFRESLEEALSWMQAVHEKLKQIDNTEGPRPALEARLRETERIRESETEGHVKMDRVLVASEALVRNGDEEMKNQTHQKLKDLKALWEDTSIYIIHCHSRIEWVWLHWSEYLKAHEEFGMWLEKMHRSLEPLLEMQLGLQEKLWQVDHLRILHSDVQAQAQFLERLLDEAAVLFDRTEDPSMDEKTQKSLQDAYIHIQDRAQERLALAQKIAEEHQQFNTCVQEFQDWLVSKTKEVSQFSNEEDSAPNRLKALQDLDASIAAEELILQHIEGLSEAVKADTSPAGADKITVEVEELRLSWERLRQAVDQSQKEVLNSLDTEKQYSLLYEQLKVDISHLRALVQNLSTDLEGRDGERTEENMVTQWKTHTGVRNKLIAEEPGVEELKRRLKELFRFPHDSKALSDEMLAVVKEYQSVKGRSFRLSSESETALRQVLQDPLYGFSQWSQAVSQVMEASAEVTEFAHIALVVQNIEKLLKNSVQLQERLSLLQVKSDLLSSVFGQEKAEDLLEELSGDMRKRELLHSQLQQRKNRLQGLISKTKHFSDAYDAIHQKLSSIKEKLLTTKGLQPDILTKKSQADQLRVIRKDLEDCEAHIIALETLVSSNSTNRTKFERLYTDWKLLHKAVWMEVKESEESIAQHESFHDNILNLEKWLMIMKQKLESFRGSDGEWSVENRQHEAERALGEFPEKELQLHQTEAQGQTVLSRTSEEGKVHISQDLKRLRDSWMSLHTLSLNLYRLLNGRADSTSRDPTIHKAEFLQHCTDGGLQQSGSDEVDAVTSIRAHTTDRAEEEMTESIRGLEWTDTTGTTERVRGVLDANNDAVRMKLSSQIFFSPMIVSEEITESCSISDPQTDSQGLRADTQAEHGEFEAWLHGENNKLAGFLNKQQSLSTRELRRRRNTLKALRADVVQGQDLFQKLMAGQASGSSEEDAVFEDLRYRWMLYKSKLKEAGDLQLQHEDTDAKKGQELVCAGKTSDRRGFLYRVWRVALPFILLLMALLLLAFLLPMMHRGSSCSLSNNFARSFNLMLRYNGPPPT